MRKLADLKRELVGRRISDIRGNFFTSGTQSGEAIILVLDDGRLVNVHQRWAVELLDEKIPEGLGALDYELPAPGG